MAWFLGSLWRSRPCFWGWRCAGHASGERAAAAVADAADAESLRRAFAGVDMTVVVANKATWLQNVAQEAPRARIDYLDKPYSAAKVGILQRMAADIEAAGCCFVTDGGFHNEQGYDSREDTHMLLVAGWLS